MMRPLPLILIAPIAALLFASAAIAQQPDATQIPAAPSPEPTIDFGISLPTAVPAQSQKPISVESVGALLPISLSGVGATPIERNVAIRQGPGLEYPRVGALRFGKSIDVVGTNGYDQTRTCLGVEFKTTLDMWLQVQVNEQRGWIARCTVIVTGDTTQLLDQSP
jgi:hypothetical protein